MSAEIAQRALAAAGPDAAVRVVHERSLTLRFAHSRPTQTTSVDDVTVEVAALRDGHVGTAATNSTEADALSEAARYAAGRAEAAARATGSGAYPGFPPAGPPAEHGGHDAATADLDPARAGAALAGLFEATSAAGTEASGLWTAGEVVTSVASTAGGTATDRATDAFVKVVAGAPGRRSGYASRTAAAAGDLGAAEVAERAAALALRDGEPAGLEPGAHPVVMEPAAVAELMWVLARSAFDGLAHTEGRGAFVGRLGEQVAAPSIGISDIAQDPLTLPRAFDAEGVRKAPLALIEGGVAAGVAHDTHSAALAGTTSTGHALRLGGAGSPRPTNLVVAGGEADGVEELCAGVERGVYVNRLWYTNVLRPKEALFTATTRDGTFLIEDGRLTRPLPDLRVTDGALDILARVEALGARPELTSDGELYGRRFAYGSVCPPLRASGVRFTGSAGDG